MAFVAGLGWYVSHLPRMCCWYAAGRLLPVAGHCNRGTRGTDCWPLYRFICSVIAAALQYPIIALLLWLTNRTLDGLDGSVARVTNRVTDAGGFVDLVLDFIIYGLVPFGITAGHEWYGEQSVPLEWAALSLMLCAFFANCCAQFVSAAILTKRQDASVKEHATTVVMPPSLVEGSETVFAFTVMLVVDLFPTPLVATSTVYFVFGSFVWANVAQRLHWGLRAFG